MSNCIANLVQKLVSLTVSFYLVAYMYFKI